MAKHALVAGGAGFIGSQLCRLLREKSYDVTAMDNLVTGQKRHLKLLEEWGVNFIQHEISAPYDWQENYDEIYNLASPASPADFPRIPLFILNTASQGHQNLLELGRKCQASVLFASSSEIYGEALQHPQKEDYWGNVNPIGVRSCYDEAKRYGESLSVAFKREFGTSIRMARIFNTYGPRMRPDDGRIIPNFFCQALRKESLTIYGEGHQTRSFCFVSDLAAGLFALMQSQEETPVNLGNPIERSVLDMANTINGLTGNTQNHVFLPLPENDPVQRRPDIGKAKEKIGWEPVVGLEEGLQKTLTYFREVVGE